MFNSGKKIVLCATKKINILTLVLSEKKILNETKNHNPPLQVKWSVPNVFPGFGNYITDIRPMISQNQSCKMKNPFLPNNRINYPYTKNKV